MKEKIPITIQAIEDDGFHLIVPALINNLKARLLLDTGASRSVFDERRLELFMDKKLFLSNDKLSTGLGTNTMESKLAVVDKLQFGKLVVGKYEVAVLDLIHVNESYENLDIPSIDGVMGSDLLMQYNAVIDYGKKILLLSD